MIPDKHSSSTKTRSTTKMPTRFGEVGVYYRNPVINSRVSVAARRDFLQHEGADAMKVVGNGTLPPAFRAPRALQRESVR